MPISIQCPDCSKKYVVSSKFLGKKVTCSTEGCGKHFVATAEVASEPEPALEFEDDDVDDFSDLPAPPARKPRMATAVDTASEQRTIDPVVKQTTKACRFAIMARGMLYAGLVVMLIGIFHPSTVFHGATGEGRFRIEAGHVFNMPEAMQKLGVMLVGVTLIIAGSALWSASEKQPTDADLVLVLTGVGMIVGLIIFQIVALNL